MIHAGRAASRHGAARLVRAWEIGDFAAESRTNVPGPFRIPSCLASAVLVTVAVLAVLILSPGAAEASERADGLSWPSVAGGHSLIL